MFSGLDVTDGFKNSIGVALSSKRLSHALILEGKNEETRFLAAKEIAKAILCKSRDSVEPCKSCSACIKCEKDVHPDLYILKKETDSTMIKVDAIRSLKAKALVYPNDGDKSVFIISEAQYMNVQAQNALLKILEEPSEHVCFILTCPSKSSFLETIISRTTAYSLGEEEYDEGKNDKAEPGEKLADELLSIFVSSNEFYFLQKTALFQKDKTLFCSVLTSMIPIIRDSLIIKSGGKELISGYPDTAKRLSDMLTQKKALALLSGVQELYNSVNGNANHNLSITRLSAIFYDIKSH